jgi:hypothetical protein
MSKESANNVERELAKAITSEIMEAAKAILAKHGMELAKSSSGFGDYYKLSIQASAVKKGKNGVNLASTEASHWLSYSSMYGFSYDEALEMLGSVVKSTPKDGDLILIGSCNRKLPIIVQSLKNGKQYQVSNLWMSKTYARLAEMPPLTMPASK